MHFGKPVTSPVKSYTTNCCLLIFPQKPNAFPKQTHCHDHCIHEALSEYLVIPMVFLALILRGCIATIENHVKYPTKECNIYVELEVCPTSYQLCMAGLFFQQTVNILVTSTVTK